MKHHPITTQTDTYIMSASDFPEGCFVRTVNGRRYGTGENKLGLTVTLALDVPLCGGCDSPLDAGVCADCQIVAGHIIPLGNDRHGVWL